MHVCNLLAVVENFVNSGLVELGVKLDMDLVLKATGQMKTPVFLLPSFDCCNFGSALVG
jgi:hypothetical protein